MANKVLVVDDESEIRDLLRTSLSAEGYEVVVASNGEEAIGLAKRENPQVILLGIEMPGIDGIETCKRLKAEEKTRLIPIIMMTTLGDRDIEAYLEGAADVVNKPFDIAELTFRVKSLLRVQHLTNEMEKALAYIEELGKDLPKA
ncbi:two-component system response regulator [Candidatus Bathyarchaeota archaeon]|nr:MAG: two-component system response regulator [Candidatus Bathyarchaeota archaeon]